MNKEIIKKWELHKQKLENYFRNTRQEEYDDYKTIVSKIIELIINIDIDYKYDVKNMLVIDDGDYQGTQIFIVHKDTYHPDINEYLYTHTYYGSCSGCDTLQSICCYEDGLPTEEQVKDYMTLSLHLVQRMKEMGGEDE